MAEFCKIRSNGTCVNAPDPLRITIVNPSDERYRYEGYLEKRYTAQPEYDTETQYITETWVRDGAYAVQTWTIHQIEPTNSDEPIEELA